MSHHQERKEKNCLNCGTLVQGRYCQHCGQENIEPKEGFVDLVKHFFYDITHFDGKLFHSIKYLLLRPGFLPKEYLKGRRASYLNPIRMYVFTSAFFFLIFFSFLHSEKGDSMVTKGSTINNKTLEQIDQMDSASFAAFTANINKNDDKPEIPMTREEFNAYKDSVISNGTIKVGGRVYKSKEEYDSLRAAGVIKHGWIKRKLIYQQIYLNKKYKNNTKQFIHDFSTILLHTIPQILFISLPLLALILKLLYIRRRKEFFYVSHAIFSIYFYIFLFMAMLILFGISSLNDYLQWGFLDVLLTIGIIGVFFYEYLAMYKFYRQGIMKTFFKFLLANILLSFVIGILFVIFIFFSLFKV